MRSSWSTRRASQSDDASISSARSTRSVSSQLLAVLFPVVAVALAGCGVNVQQVDTASPLAGVNISGRVHGGVFPIDGATIRLMQTQSSGYGGKAVNLLTTTSDQNGNFTFPNTGWTCASGQFAYITVTSGYTVNLG